MRFEPTTFSYKEEFTHLSTTEVNLLKTLQHKCFIDSKTTEPIKTFDSSLESSCSVDCRNIYTLLRIFIQKIFYRLRYVKFQIFDMKIIYLSFFHSFPRTGIRFCIRPYLKKDFQFFPYFSRLTFFWQVCFLLYFNLDKFGQKDKFC